MGAIASLLIALVLAITIRRERKARRRFQILGEIATVSEAGGSLGETFDAICAVLVPGVADFCMIDVLDEDRVPSRVAVRVGPGGRPEFEQGLAERLPSTPQPMVEGQSRSSLEPRFYERMSERRPA